MSWQILLKAPPITGEQELPDTKLMYVMYLSAPNGLEIVRQIIQTNKSNRGIRNIPKWNQQIINTETDRLSRQFPQIRNIEDVQKNANSLASDMTELTNRDVSYKSIDTTLNGLIDAEDFEGIEKFLHSDDKNPGKRKKAISININKIKQLISSNPPDKYIDAYYYDITDFSFESASIPLPNLRNLELPRVVRGYVRLQDGNLRFIKKKGKFENKIPPYIKIELEKALNKKLKLPPSKLVKYVGSDITAGMPIQPEITTGYEINISNPADVFNYLNILVKLGITSNEFMIGPTPNLFFGTVFKKASANTPMIYPALRVILKEPKFNVDDWYMSDKGTKQQREELHLRDKFLRQWTITRTKSRTGEKITEDDINETLQADREEKLAEGSFESLRNLFKLSPTARKKALATNKKFPGDILGIKDIYDSYMQSVRTTLEEGKFLFSEENYDFLVELEKEIDKGIDIDKLANHFGIQDATKISETLEDILTNEIMESKVKISDLFDKPTTVGEGNFKYTGRKISTNLNKKIKEQLTSNPSQDLIDLEKDVNALYNFLKTNKAAIKPAEKKTIVSLLKEMDGDSITVSDFSPTQLTLEDILEMMCQLNWIFGDKTLIRRRNRFIRAMEENKTKKEIPSFVTEFEKEYPNIRNQLVEATKAKIGDMIKDEKTISHYDRLVKNRYNSVDFFGRLTDANVITRRV